MYTHRRYRIEEFAIPLTEEPMGLDALLDAASTVKDVCNHLEVDIEDLGEASWEITGWPTKADPDHLVMRIIIREPAVR